VVGVVVEDLQEEAGADRRRSRQANGGVRWEVPNVLLGVEGQEV